MNNIFNNLDGDMYELIMFMDKHHPDILKSQIHNKNNKSNNYSFFLNTIFKLKNDNFEEHFIELFNLFKKYDYNINSYINKEDNEVNELLTLLIYDRTKNIDFVINQFIDYPIVKKAEINHNYNLLLLLFKNNCSKLIQNLSNEKDLWNNEKINDFIVNYLSSSKNVELINLFYSIKDSFNTSNQIVNNLIEEQDQNINASKNNVFLNSFIGSVNNYMNSPIKERNYVLINDYIENLKTIDTPYKESALNYCFYNSIKLFNYVYKKIGKPTLEKPIWIFDKNNINYNQNIKFQDKDIYYYLVSNFKPTDFENINEKKEYFIDHLLQTIHNLNVSLYSSNQHLKSRNINIINSLNDYINPYLNIMIDGNSLISREFKKSINSEKSIFNYCSDFKNEGLTLDIGLSSNNFNSIIKMEFLNNLNIESNYNLRKLNYIKDFQDTLLNTTLDTDLHKFFILNYHYLFSANNNSNDNINQKLLSNLNNVSFNEYDLNNIKQIVDNPNKYSSSPSHIKFYNQALAHIECSILNSITKESSSSNKLTKL